MKKILKGNMPAAICGGLMMFSLCAAPLQAKVVLPSLFRSGMVMQRGTPVPVWGTADKGEKVTVVFKKKTYETVAGDDGRWLIELPAQKAGGPYTVDVAGTVLSDVLFGDVWLCSGQSNIDTDVERVYPRYESEIDSYKNDDIRLFRVQTVTNLHGHSEDVKATGWRKLDKNNAWNFSAVGYFLAKRMYEKTGVPQGVICNSLGGTPIESWIEGDSLKNGFTQYYLQTELCKDDEMLKAYAMANQRANNRWNSLLDENDPGLKGGWNTLAYDDSLWPEVNQYGSLLPNGGGWRNYVGSLWVRQHIHVDAEHAGKPARLLLGTLYDMDYTFVNGREVGRTYYQYPPRRYQIPAGLLREGDNVITVRFINKNGMPHFIQEKPYEIIFSPGDTMKIGEQWRVSEGARMPSPLGGGTSVQNLPSVLYNAMLYPLAPYPMSGVVWYQGESNTGRSAEYAPLLRKLMANWRQVFNQPQLPFAIVQLANFMQPSAGPQDSQWARLRDAQREVAYEDGRSELVVAIDLGEATDIHPLQKKDVAERAGMAFDRLVYGKKVTLSPKVVKTDVQGRRVTVTFDQPLAGGAMYEFELAGPDGRFVNASAEANGNAVVVECEGVSNPVQVRYAWKDNPAKANCYGKNGLPATPFSECINKKTNL